MIVGSIVSVIIVSLIVIVVSVIVCVLLINLKIKRSKGAEIDHEDIPLGKILALNILNRH